MTELTKAEEIVLKKLNEGKNIELISKELLTTQDDIKEKIETLKKNNIIE